MGGTISGGVTVIADFPDRKRKERAGLLHLQADVEPDGASAMLSVHTTNGLVDLSITIEQMTSTVAEMREAGAVMLQRQLKDQDKGRTAFDHMVRRAPRAASITPTLDKLTGDVIIVYRFSDRMPFSVRLSHEQFWAARAAFSSELKRSSN